MQGRQQTLQFCLRPHLNCAWAGALGPQVEHIGPLAQETLRLAQGRSSAFTAAAIAKGIGGEIDHPHHTGALAPWEVHSCCFPFQPVRSGQSPSQGPGSGLLALFCRGHRVNWAGALRCAKDAGRRFPIPPWPPARAHPSFPSFCWDPPCWPLPWPAPFQLPQGPLQPRLPQGLGRRPPRGWFLGR